jgi:hypothetical protein
MAMTQYEWLMNIGAYAAQAAFWAALVFPVVTSSFWPWWRHVWGWAFVLLDLAMAVVLLGSVLELEWGVVQTGTGAIAWSRSIGLCLVPVIIVWRACAVFVAQRRGSDDRNAHLHSAWQEVRPAGGGAGGGQHRQVRAVEAHAAVPVRLRH